MVQYKKLGIPLAFAAASLMAGCATTTRNPDLPSGQAAYEIIPAEYRRPDHYVLSAGDKLNLHVFGEQELSNPSLLIDSSGNIQTPLIADLRVEGMTTDELSKAIAKELARRYLVNPQVSVSVAEPKARFVTVEGEVKSPGVYEIEQGYTLLSALARGQSPTPQAKLQEVVILRDQGGKRMAGQFNVKRIRTGLDPDPVLMNGDVVTVGTSASRAVWQNIVATAPIFNAFVVFGNSL